MIPPARCLAWPSCYAATDAGELIVKLSSSYLLFFAVNMMAAAALLVISARPWPKPDVPYHDQLLLWMQAEEVPTAAGDAVSGGGSASGYDKETLMVSPPVEDFKDSGKEQQNGSEQTVHGKHGDEYVSNNSSSITHDHDDLQKRSEEFIAKMFDKWKEERLRSKLIRAT